MKDEAYKKLQEKYKRKCKKLTEANAQNEMLHARIDELEDPGNYHRIQARHFIELSSALGYHLYRTNYTATSISGGIKNEHENISACHPSVACYILKQRCYADLNIISIEKVY